MPILKISIAKKFRINNYASPTANTFVLVLCIGLHLIEVTGDWVSLYIWEVIFSTLKYKIRYLLLKSIFSPLLQPIAMNSPYGSYRAVKP